MPVNDELQPDERAAQAGADGAAPAEEPQPLAEPADDTLAALQRDLETARGQAAEYLDGWRRAQADIANQRRRHEREKAESEALANARLLRQLLPIVDDFDRAVQTVPAELQDLQWTGGILLIARKLHQVLEGAGVQPIPVRPGDPFDPNVHEAVLQEETPGFDSGQIVAELQKGYKLGDRVIRPAAVKVAR